MYGPLSSQHAETDVGCSHGNIVLWASEFLNKHRRPTKGCFGCSSWIRSDQLCGIKDNITCVYGSIFVILWLPICDTEVFPYTAEVSCIFHQIHNVSRIASIFITVEYMYVIFYRNIVIFVWPYIDWTCGLYKENTGLKLKIHLLCLKMLWM